VVTDSQLRCGKRPFCYTLSRMQKVSFWRRRKCQISMGKIVDSIRQE